MVLSVFHGNPSTGTCECFIDNDVTIKELYPYTTEIQDISELLREYIDTPVHALFDKVFISDKWGLTDILKAADKRIGKRRVAGLQKNNKKEAIQKIVKARCCKEDSN